MAIEIATILQVLLWQGFEDSIDLKNFF